MSRETIAVIDFGGQTSQLIARRVRDNNVHSVLCGPAVTAAELRQMNVAGVIFSGGPGSVYDPKAPRCTADILDMGVPVLGICYGFQLMSAMLGGQVEATRSVNTVEPGWRFSVRTLCCRTCPIRLPCG